MESEPPKILLVTNKLELSPTGGRQLLCRLNHDALKDIYGERLVVFELFKRPIRGFKPFCDAFRGEIDGLNSAVISEILTILQTGNIGAIFVDGSNLGGFVKTAKTVYPRLQVSTFFHNVESRFFWGSLRQTRSVRAVAVLIANFLAERKAVCYSDKIICLSRRDSNLLRKLYGRAATDIAPMVMQDKLPNDLSSLTAPVKEKYALFVGGVFYANQAGITWFVRKVVPRVHIKICIVGKGFEHLKQELERDGKVEVIGAVDSLAPWYLHAHFVIAPIFDGSGMKTKVAEALMFGKKVIGTPEAFSGYENLSGEAGWACRTADEFVNAIRRAESLPIKAFEPQLRRLYEENYSFRAACARLSGILGSIN